MIKGRKRRFKDGNKFKENLFPCGETIPAKDHYVYLGETLHGGALSKSAEMTVNRRKGRARQMIYEVSAFLSDLRADKNGGLKCGLILYEMVILPPMLNSCDTWYMMNNQTLKMLENVQISMFRQFLQASPSTPQSLLRFDLGF